MASVIAFKGSASSLETRILETNVSKGYFVNKTSDLPPVGSITSCLSPGWAVHGVDLFSELIKSF